MNWTLPVPMLLFAGVVALLPLAGLVRWPTSAPRLVAEAFTTALAVIGAFWIAWGAHWLLEQRWWARVMGRHFAGISPAAPLRMPASIRRAKAAPCRMLSGPNASQ